MVPTGVVANTDDASPWPVGPWGVSHAPVEVLIDGPEAITQKPIRWLRHAPMDEPHIEVLFRFEDSRDLGIFRLQTASWSFASDLAYNGTVDQLGMAKGPMRATLEMKRVSYVARNGLRAGQIVIYAKPVLELLSAVG